MKLNLTKHILRFVKYDRILILCLQNPFKKGSFQNLIINIFKVRLYKSSDAVIDFFFQNYR